MVCKTTPSYSNIYIYIYVLFFLYAEKYSRVEY